MGLLMVAAIVALALTLMALATVALVQLVLFVTVRNTLLAVAVVGVYWFVDSRRRQVAKGFYSCTELPGSAADGGDAKEMTTKALSRHRGTKSSRDSADMPSSARRAIREGEDDKEEKSNDTTPSSELKTTSVLHVAAPSTAMATTTDAGPRTVDDKADDATTEEQRHSLASNASEAMSCTDEVPLAAAAAPTSPVVNAAHQRTTTSPMRLPDLRHRKWKHPTRSASLAPKGESLLQENRKTGSGSGRVRSASNSPRRPERYGSPRSVAMEQKLMKSALESDGYWIGDFRVPAPPLAKRSTSTGASTPTKTTTKMTSAASFSSGATKSISSTTATTTVPTPAYRRSNSHRV